MSTTPAEHSCQLATPNGQRPRLGKACAYCSSQRAVVKRPKTGDHVCRDCFFAAFEEECHQTITQHQLFSRGDRVAIGASGGKDSTVLAHVLKVLNERHDYGLELLLLSIDEGIAGYRDDSLETVKRNRDQYQLPLTILSYQELYGWSMDEIVKQVGRKNNCTFCGVFRRQALDRGADQLKVQHIVTGHNADDIAETVLMNCTSPYHGDGSGCNEDDDVFMYMSSFVAYQDHHLHGILVLRGDIARLQRCTDISSLTEGYNVRRSKPFKYAYEKEIVMYAYFKKLDYFSTECTYSPDAYRGHARTFLKDLERVRPTAILDIIRSGEACRSLDQTIQSRLPTQTQCERCGHLASGKICKACLLLEGLNRGLPRLGIGRATQSLRT